MATKTITVPVLDDHAEPVWEVALLFPAQGAWNEDDYLWLTDHTKHLVEFTNGRIEVLPMPTDEYQLHRPLPLSRSVCVPDDAG